MRTNGSVILSIIKDGKKFMTAIVSEMNPNGFFPPLPTIKFVVLCFTFLLLCRFHLLSLFRGRVISLLRLVFLATYSETSLEQVLNKMCSVVE